MPRGKNYLLLPLIFWVGFTIPSAQRLVETLGVDDGLSQGLVTDILQDREGFLWFSTWSGLNRYDGRRFVNFHHSLRDSQSLRSDQVLSLADFDDYLLVSTDAGGIDAYEKATRTFRPVRAGDATATALVAQRFNTVATDGEGRWYAILGRGRTESRLARFRLEVRRREVLLTEAQEIPIPWLRQEIFIAAGEDRPYLVSNERLYWIDPDRPGLTLDSLPLPPGFRASLFTLGKDGEIWGGTEGELLRWTGERWHRYPLDAPADALVYDRNDDRLLILSNAEGIQPQTTIHFAAPSPAKRYGEDNKRGRYGGVIRQFRYTDADTAVLTETGKWTTAFDPHFETVRTVFRDRTGIFWMATSGYGVHKFDPAKQRFRTLLSGQSVRSPLGFNRNGELGLLRGGTWYFPTAPPGRGKEYPDEPNGAANLLTDSSGTEWLLTRPRRSGWRLQRRPAGGSWETVIARRPRPGERNALFNRLDLRLDENGRSWIADFEGVTRYDPATVDSDPVAHFPFPEAWDLGKGVWQLYLADADRLWVATDGGLIRGDRRNADDWTFTRYRVGKDPKTGLTNSEISSVLPDPLDRDLLWIGSRGGGISRLRISEGRFEHWGREEGLRDLNIYGLLADELGRVWWSSNQGLSYYDPGHDSLHQRTAIHFATPSPAQRYGEGRGEDNKREMYSGLLHHFNVHDGLPANEFNRLAFAAGPDGRFYFGSVKGLVVFDPVRLQPDSLTPPVVITGLKVDNRDWSDLGQPESSRITDPAFLREIRLRYDRNDLEIAFAGLQYGAPEKHRFRYYLEGREEPWQHESSQNRVAYLDLRPGKYRFHVIASNGDGIWHRTPTTLSLRIFPPWWRTTFAYLIYGLLGLLAATALFLYLLRRQSLRFQLLNEKREKDRLRALDRFRSSLYESVAHEFRSPLSVIKSSTEILLDNDPESDNRRQLTAIRRGSARMLAHVERMLSLASVDKNQLPYHPRTGELAPFLASLVEEYRPVARERSVDLELKINTPTVVATFDPYYYAAILGNLLDNAIKYGGAGSRVSLTFALDRERKRLNFRVSDNGAGISPADLPRLFERHFRGASESGKAGGFGIGLAYVRALVEGLDGRIEVESEVKKGTVFTVRLPFSNGREPTSVSGDVSVPSAPAKSSSHQPPSLLIVEDNDELRRFLVSQLEEEYRVLTAGNGVGGLETALEAVPDLILTDLVMPELDGLDLVQRLKDDERTSHIPVVLLTAKVGLETRLAGLARGADAYLAKPFNLRELRAQLTNLEAQRRRFRERYRIDASAPTTADDPELAFLRKVATICGDRLGDENFGAPELCRELGVSRTQLHNKLKSLTGDSTSIFLRKQRLRRARTLLETTSLNVTEIAYAVGFRYVNQLSRFYAETYGESPSATRKRR